MTRFYLFIAALCCAVFVYVVFVFDGAETTEVNAVAPLEIQNKDETISETLHNIASEQGASIQSDQLYTTIMSDAYSGFDEIDFSKAEVAEVHELFDECSAETYEFVTLDIGNEFAGSLTLRKNSSNIELVTATPYNAAISDNLPKEHVDFPASRSLAENRLITNGYEVEDYLGYVLPCIEGENLWLANNPYHSFRLYGGGVVYVDTFSESVIEREYLVSQRKRERDSLIQEQFSDIENKQFLAFDSAEEALKHYYSLADESEKEDLLTVNIAKFQDSNETKTLIDEHTRLSQTISDDLLIMFIDYYHAKQPDSLKSFVDGLYEKYPISSHVQGYLDRYSG